MAAIVNARDALLQAPGTVRLIATDLEDPLSMFSAVKSWDFRNSLEGWTIGGAGNVLRADSFDLSSSGSDPQINSPALTINGGFYDKVRARVRRKGGTGWQGSLYYKTPDRQTFEELFTKQVTDATVNGNWVVLEWDMGDTVNWTTKTITQIRLDLGASVSDVFEIDWISVGRYGPVSLSDLGYTGALNATYGADWATNVNGAGTVNQAIADAAADASAAATDADAALTRLGSMSNDAVIDRTEKLEIVKEWKVVTDERAGIQARADEMGVSRVAYDNAYSALSTYLGTLAYTDYTKDNAVVRSTFNTNWATLYTQRQLLLNAIVGASAKNVFAPTRTWDFAADAEGWVGESATATITQGTNSIIVTSAGADPRLGSASGLALVGSQNDKWRMRLRRTAGTGWQGCLYYTTTAGPNALHGSSSSYQKTIATDPTIGGAWTIMEWDMAALTAGGTDYVLSTIGQVRFDLGASASDVFEIDWITVGKHGPAISAIDLAAAANTASWGSVNGKPLDSEIMNSELDPKFAGLDTPYLRWDFASSVEGFSFSTATLTHDATDGTIVWTPTGSNPVLSKGIPAASKFNGKDYTRVRARVKRVSGTGPWEGNLYYGTAGPVATHGAVTSAYARVTQPANPDDWNILEWDMTKLEAGGTDWLDNIIDMIRIDLVSSNSPASSWKIDWVAIGKFNTGVSPTEVKGIQADLATLTTNFNSTNDRNSAAVAAPTIATDGTAVDHTIRTDGSADISFEWAWAGNEGDIDGFLVYVFQRSATGAYTFGTTPAEETVFTVPANKRAFILTGAAANLYTTFGVQAYRSVDKDVNAAGVIKSTLVKPSLVAENPYQPSSSVAFAGNVTGTINGTAVATVVSNASAGKTANDALPAMNTAITGKLAKNANDTITGQIALQSQYALLVGTANDGIFYGSTGMYGRKGGVTQLSIGADGTAYFGGTLGANIVDAGNIKAGAVRASHLIIQGDVTNLIRDPRFEDPNWWSLPGHNYGRGDWSTTQTTAWKDNCSLYLYSTGNQVREFWTKEMMIEPGAEYYFEYQISFSGDFDGDVAIHWYMPMVSWYNFGVPSSGYVFSDNSSEIHYPSNSRGFKQVTGSVYIPADPRLVKSAIRVRFRVNTGSFELGGFRIIRKQETVTIRDGVITASKMNLPWGGYINSGQWGFDAGDGFWLQGGDDPRFSIGAGNARLTFQKSTGVLKMRGAIEGSSIRTSALGIESARMITDWNMTAPFVIFDTAGSYNANATSKTVTLTDICGPAYTGVGYHSKRLASFRKDIFIKVTVNGDFGWENVYIDVEYHKNGGWNNIASTSADFNYRAGVTIVVRYTPWFAGWDWIAFRARTSQGRTYSITMEIQVFNFNETTFSENTCSGINGSDATYTPPPPTEREPYCVDFETARFPDGTYVRDVLVDDMVECWNEDPINPATEYAAALRVRFGHEESYRIRSESGAELLQSKSTPMTLRDGRMIYTPALLGEEILVKRGNDFAWERVVTLENIGVRKVVKLSLGDRTFFAGTDPEATIATHNIQQMKP
jgi:hypothetical protein